MNQSDYDTQLHHNDTPYQRISWKQLLGYEHGYYNNNYKLNYNNNDVTVNKICESYMKPLSRNDDYQNLHHSLGPSL